MSDEAKPFAWAVIGDGYEYATLLVEHAGAVAEEEGGRVVPLYRSPTLTDAEREALYWFTGGRGPVCPQHLATIRNLMARLS